MTKEECLLCENEIMLDMADLQIDYHKMQKYNKLLKNSLDAQIKLNDFLREEYENEINRNTIYQETIKKYKQKEED